MINKVVDNRSYKLAARKLADNPERHELSLGCHSCHHFTECGGLHVEESIVDCLELCCGKPESCTSVCRNKPEMFVQQMKEIGGFDLGNVDPTLKPEYELNDDIVPLIYHGYTREKAYLHSTLALRLSDVVNFRTGELRFATKTELCRAFRVDESAALILTGVNHDYRIEPWWTLGERRLPLIDQMKAMGIELVTTPNFSVALDQPRTDDMHAMKRIGLVFAEFQSRGLACALHSHGRTDRDFERWADFIRDREEVRVLAYEFITGPGKKLRRGYHLKKLAMISHAAGRELDIVLRGTPEVIPFLRKYFRRVIYLESEAFVKSIRRQKARRSGNRKLAWQPSYTRRNAVVDHLLEHNARERIDFLRSSFYLDPSNDPLSRAA